MGYITQYASLDKLSVLGESITMEVKYQRILSFTFGLIIAVSLSACSKDVSTLAGSSIGAAGGTILTDGNPLAAAGGAAVGGMVGRKLGKK